MSAIDDSDYAPIIDPRDDIMGTFHYWHPDPIPHGAQINGVFGHEPGIEQLILIELLDHGLIAEDDEMALALTPKGLDLVQQRLEKEPAWADYFVKPRAPKLPNPSRRLIDALRSFDFRKDSAKYAQFCVFHSGDS